MIGIYFSGTGNTKYCVERFVHYFDSATMAVSIEQDNIDALLADHGTVVFGYPVYYSNIPKIVRDFITDHKNSFAGKKIFIIATMGLFSGDGAGCSARLLKKYGASVTGGLHITMPDCIGDVKLLKKSLEKNRALVRAAEKKIDASAERMKQGRPDRNGLNIFSHAAGLFCQRLWFYGETNSYKSKPKIDRDNCIVCGICVKNCPMKNLKQIEGSIISGKKCTLCYRCVSTCPAKALTIIGKKVYEQCLLDKYA
ncbi:EFR1 family ferrodoxin [Breznakiella homolactica]|uniref:EFR1 family ferrodoxin n=1 Tax=Breznakiella homolactica TaxID=2798577 RepID=A0A7T8BBF4_9SPIR|nr:EFR1 family ferrodoxin [Breznakiella homolactica]QQO09980.1 EFR1 family ferrodoxin [Breznakiella homolactica]